MAVYLMKMSYPKYPFFSKLTKFQQCMFKRIHWILTSSDGPTKFLYNRSVYVEVQCTAIEYANEKDNPTLYLFQLVDLDYPND